MIRCMVIDDEEMARRQLARLLAFHTDIQIAGEAGSGVEALERIPAVQPHMIFLDIEMPGLNGFEMLAQLSHPPHVVFATAYDEYAIRAFDVSAIDYLLKPIQPARLAQALERVRATLDRPREAHEASLRLALSTLRTSPLAKLAGRRGKRIVLLAPKDVVCVVVEDQIVFLHTKAERFATDRTVADLEELLAPTGFVRISRSAVVNLEHVRELLPWPSGRWKLKLSNNTELDVSRNRARHLKSRLE